MFTSKKQKYVTFIVFGLYLFLLIWLILFKFSTNFDALGTIRGINLIPFGGSLIVNGRISLKEIIYNILVFVPLGVYIHLLKPKWNLLQKILPILCISLLFEVLQFIFAIGASDITDLIGNTSGGIIGIGLCILFAKIFKQKYITIINVIGIMIEVFAFCMLGLLFIANM